MFSCLEGPWNPSESLFKSSLMDDKLCWMWFSSFSLYDNSKSTQNHLWCACMCVLYGGCERPTLCEAHFWWGHVSWTEDAAVCVSQQAEIRLLMRRITVSFPLLLFGDQLIVLLIFWRKHVKRSLEAASHSRGFSLVIYHCVCLIRGQRRNSESTALGSGSDGYYFFY